MTTTDSGAVVVGFDGSGTAEAALRWALGEAARTHLRLHVVTVRHPGEPEDKRLTGRVSELCRANPAVPVRHHQAQGGVGEVLVAESDSAALLVVGSHGVARVLSALLGSVSAYCVRYALCPVVVIPSVMAEPEPEPVALTPGPLL